jgi:hypothetical protein
MRAWSRIARSFNRNVIILAVFQILGDRLPRQSCLAHTILRGIGVQYLLEFRV